jgi:hypothetical protein
MEVFQFDRSTKFLLFWSLSSLDYSPKVKIETGKELETL